jgi:hypothetical protein
MDFKFLETLFSRIPADSIGIIVLAFVIWKIVKSTKKSEIEESKFAINRLTLLGICLIVVRLFTYLMDKLLP